ncbi:glycosyltransferase family 4 protein [Sedimentitalea todarodis]|uniref:Glycosyltransferase family 4 protein n=1 Tax=Sedimentitalea todarodis TaxID=1631240 RepID=A0ABU3VDZ5_9RHOB|nr:glycosyltransferase family 4 protein [Sedimentitalea todarodis]MDU9004376.1 glycosyltransferase family 4 protein [Sedimentitalea todarodis]
MKAVFAIPGDMHRKTGGFIYEAEVLAALNRIGVQTMHLQLPDSFPDPSPHDMATTLAALAKVPANIPVILDGFIAGTIDPYGAAQLAAPLLAITHHPLGFETGLTTARASLLVEKERAALAQMAHVIVPSPHTAAILCSDFGLDEQDITVAPPGFSRPPAHIALPQTPPLILSVGLLAPRKGHDTLLAALAEIVDLPWCADIVGKAHDAATTDALHQLRADLGLDDRVTFSGEIDSASLRARFGAATLFALATRYEGYGMVFGEAMLCGLPIVSCDTGAVPQTVGDAGILVPPGDAGAFGAALRQMLTDADTRVTYASASAQQGSALPTWEDTAQIIANVIRTVACEDNHPI